jgi:hypothetical protein
MSAKRITHQTKRDPHLAIIKLPTITSAPPVAHEGIDAKIGAKKIEIKNIIPTVSPVRPVLPPSIGI